MAEAAPQQHHRRVRVLGCDPNQSHRTATPLELLFDLTFVVAFGVAGNEFAHFLADEHTTPTTGSSACSPWCRWWAC